MPKILDINDKCNLGGTKNDTIGMPVNFSGLPQEIEIAGERLYRRSSFHVSLVCIGQIIEKYQVVIPDFINKVAADFRRFSRENNISFLGCRDEFRFARQDKLSSVIVMCDISNLNKFFDLLNRKYSLNVSYQPTHITLYTRQPDKGIYLTDEDDLNKFTKLIRNPGLKLV